MDEQVFETKLDYEQTERFTSLLLKFLGQKWKPDTEFFPDFHITFDGEDLTIIKDEYDLKMTVDDVDRLFNTIVEDLDKITDIDAETFSMDISIAMGGIYTKCNP